MKNQKTTAELFLREDNMYGCAETAYLALHALLEQDLPVDSSIAMALNGGVAYSGGICGAVSGAAMAVGEFIGRQIPDHSRAKNISRAIIMELMEHFRQEFGSVDCRVLCGYDFLTPGEHDKFIDEGRWKKDCLRQIDFSLQYVKEHSPILKN